MEPNEMKSSEIKSKIYYDILYQITHNLMLENYQDTDEIISLISYLNTELGYTSEQHKQFLKDVKAVSDPQHNLNLTIYEVTDIKISQVSEHFAPKLFVTAEFESSNEFVRSTIINEIPVWNETLSFCMDEHRTNESLLIKVWNIYPPEEEVFLKQRLVGGLFFKHLLPKSPVKNINNLEKQSSYLLAETRVPVNEIKLLTNFTWKIIDKCNEENKKGCIKLRFEYVLQEREAFRIQNIEEYKEVLRLLLCHELSELKVKGKQWSRNFAYIRNALLSTYKMNKLFLKSDLKLTEWIVYSQLQNDYFIEFSLFNEILDDMLVSIQNTKLSTEKLLLFWASTVQILKNSMTFVKDFKFDNELYAVDLLVMLVKIEDIKQLVSIEKFKKKFMSISDVNSDNFIIDLVTNAIRANAEKWYYLQVEHPVEKRFQLYLLKQQESCKDDLIKASLIITNLEAYLENLNSSYANLFERHLKINIVELFYCEFETHFIQWINDRIKIAVQEINFSVIQTYQDNVTKRTLLNELKILYFKLKTFTKTFIQRLLPKVDLIKMNIFYDWFDVVLPLWFVNKRIGCEELIEKAIDLNQILEDKLYSSSALDTIHILYALLQEFKEFDWSRKEVAFILITDTIINEISIVCLSYSSRIIKIIDQNLNKKNEEIKLEKTTLQSFSSAMNNLEYISNKIVKLIEEFYIQILSPNDFIILHKAYPGLNGIQIQLKNKLTHLTERLVNSKISYQLKMLLKHTVAVTSKDPKSFESVKSYILYLLTELSTTLSENNKKIMLNLIWFELILQITNLLEKQAFAEHNLQLFIQIRPFFKEVKSLFKEAVDLSIINDPLILLENKLEKYSYTASELMYSYYLKLNKLQDYATRSYGILTIIGNFIDDTLKLCVLNGSYLLPKITANSDDDKPDTFVEIQFLLNNHKKPDFKTLKTQTIFKNDFPLYEKEFTIQLPENKETLKETIIVFSLWDPDYFGMIQNFLGEASIFFKDIIESDGKQIKLNLWKPHDKNNEYLSHLKSRTEKEARELYKYFKMKCDDKRINTKLDEGSSITNEN